MLKRRMSYVAVSRARLDARVFTDSEKDLARRWTGGGQANGAGGSRTEVERKWAAVTAEDSCARCAQAGILLVVVTPDTAKSERDSEHKNRDDRKHVSVAVFCRRVESGRTGHGGWYHDLPDGADV